MGKNVVGRWQVGGFWEILETECAKILYEILRSYILKYDSETTLWNEKERSRMDG